MKQNRQQGKTLFAFSAHTTKQNNDGCSELSPPDVEGAANYFYLMQRGLWTFSTSYRRNWTIFTWCKGDCGCELFLPDVEGAVLLANDSDTHCHASPEQHRYFYQWIFKLSGNVCRIKWAIMCKRRGVNMAIRSCHPAPPTLKEFHKNKAVFDDKNESTFIQGNIHLDPQSPCM